MFQFLQELFISGLDVSSHYVFRIIDAEVNVEYRIQ